MGVRLPRDYHYVSFVQKITLAFCPTSRKLERILDKVIDAFGSMSTPGQYASWVTLYQKLSMFNAIANRIISQASFLKKKRMLNDAMLNAFYENVRKYAKFLLSELEEIRDLAPKVLASRYDAEDEMIIREAIETIQAFT